MIEDVYRGFGLRWNITDPEGWLENCCRSFDELESEGTMPPSSWNNYSLDRLQRLFPTWLDAALILNKHKAIELMLDELGYNHLGLTLKDKLCLYYLECGQE